MELVAGEGSSDGNRHDGRGLKLPKAAITIGIRILVVVIIRLMTDEDISRENITMIEESATTAEDVISRALVVSRGNHEKMCYGIGFNN